jgi:serine/threonine-protein phosphatase PP1 catalytic subunit
MIVGHTPVDGYKLYGNQLIISSSYTKGRKAYVELDLKKDISNGGDLKKMVRYLR